MCRAARVCFFKPSSLAKGILFANFSPFSLAKGILFANFNPFSLAKGIHFANFRPFNLGKGILLGNFGQRNVKLPLFLQRNHFFQILVLRMQQFGKFCLENANSWHF